MQIAFFDLDNTLLANDSDVAWGQFVVDEGWVDREQHARDSAAFHAQYETGELDIYAFQRFTLSPLFGHPWPVLDTARERFVDSHIEPMVAPWAQSLLRYHAAAGHTLAIVTATNRFIAEPIAKRLGVETLIATEPEFINGGYTGEIIGAPAYRDGKIERVRHMLENGSDPVEQTYFYSDSHNDLPLLRHVDIPVAVDPDTILEAEARTAGWPIISLRGQTLPWLNNS